MRPLSRLRAARVVERPRPVGIRVPVTSREAPPAQRRELVARCRRHVARTTPLVRRFDGAQARDDWDALYVPWLRRVQERAQIEGATSATVRLDEGWPTADVVTVTVELAK